MRVEIKRYFDNGIIEVATWQLAGTGTISMGDDRCVPIGNMVDGLDKWLLISVVNCSLNINPVTIETLSTHTYKYLAEQNGMVKVFDTTVTFQLPNTNYYELELKPGYTEMSKEEYETMFYENG